MFNNFETCQQYLMSFILRNGTESEEQAFVRLHEEGVRIFVLPDSTDPDR
jgi:hypothetical protein